HASEANLNYLPSRLEEVVDPLPALREKCTEHHCMNFKELLDQCTERVTSKKKTSETCHQEMVDLIHCVDHCKSNHSDVSLQESARAMPQLFKKLK
uniref:Cytochrome b-c1 complex subunit 6 n=1 Tax=Romanomermis culicivorax TaxID=13658 RepID=A0A915JEZ6_ROMCU